MEQSRIQTQQSAIAELQGQVQALQVSLASWKESAFSGYNSGRCEPEGQSFQLCPRYHVNTNWGAAMVYELPDQAFSFQKHVRFGDRPNRPDLELGVAGSGAPMSPITTEPPQMPPHSSMPFHGVKSGTVESDI